MRSPGRVGIGFTCALLLGAGMSRAASVAPGSAECLSCHDHPEFSMLLEDGSSMNLFVSAATFAASVHADELICTDCHVGYENDHPRGAIFESRRSYVLGAYETCKSCHFDSYTRTLESVHYELLRRGDVSAPVCTDCHGAHDVPNPHVKQTMVSKSCGSCHTEIYDQYAASVHGKALVEADNQDVPACADCHTHHEIQAPGARFHLSSPEICIRCHSEEKRMSKYGISTDVAETYLADFHGVTASLSNESNPDSSRVVVTCVDCHGVHDMASPRELGSEAMKETVVNACATCHEGAAPDFPAAWLSHYKPSLQHAPLVYLVNLFYRIFVPFIVIGLVLQILLHLYRVSAGR